MEAILNISEIPYHYPMCLNHECPQADTCLRQLIERCVPADVEHFVVISPKYLAALEGACPLYRSATKVRYAKGLIKVLDNLPYKQMRNVISRLKGAFSERTYFRIRMGERLLSPFEQQEIRKIFKRCGVSDPPEFDEYMDGYDW